MNLFLRTSILTDQREDHLTYFLAAALENDDAFREAYENRVLLALAESGKRPLIRQVRTQVHFPATTCCPDLELQLEDGRVVLCEHKLEAPETQYQTEAGEVFGQLQRYLELPVNAVAYFRAAIHAPPREVVAHPKYLKPHSSLGTPHFLWRDLYEPLSAGNHVVTNWLFEGFRKLGFTPPLPHIGELWPEHADEVRSNQENFGKLWQRTISLASVEWTVGRARRCALDLRPRSPRVVSRVAVSPLIQDGSILRVRAQTDASQVNTAHQLLDAVAQHLPIKPEIMSRVGSRNTSFIDLLVPLHEVLEGAREASIQEERLFRQVFPILTALLKAP